MTASSFSVENIDIAWCPGCGNHGIRNMLMQALHELGMEPHDVVIVSGIGQAAKLPHYLKCHTFNGLHGRALPPAIAIKASNPELTVIAESGDGDMYGEGGNHFSAAIRRNPDLTNIVHNNMVYGLTKGQASPTSQRGFMTPVQVSGVILEPFNPIAVAIALDAAFVARAYIGDMEQTKDIIKKAITFRGYALLDIFQPCVTFNRMNTFQWFRDHTYYLEDSHNPHDRLAAFQKAVEHDPMPLGIFYQSPPKKTFEENLSVYENSSVPIIKRKQEVEQLIKLIDSFDMKE